MPDANVRRFHVELGTKTRVDTLKSPAGDFSVPECRAVFRAIETFLLLFICSTLTFWLVVRLSSAKFVQPTDDSLSYYRTS